MGLAHDPRIPRAVPQGGAGWGEEIRDRLRPWGRPRGAIPPPPADHDSRRAAGDRVLDAPGRVECPERRDRVSRIRSRDARGRRPTGARRRCGWPDAGRPCPSGEAIAARRTPSVRGAPTPLSDHAEPARLGERERPGIAPVPARAGCDRPGAGAGAGPRAARRGRRRRSPTDRSPWPSARAGPRADPEPDCELFRLGGEHHCSAWWRRHSPGLTDDRPRDAISRRGRDAGT